MNSHKSDLKIINKALNEVINTDTFKNLCKEYGVNSEIVWNVAIKFDDGLDTSARTEKGVIYLNGELRDKEDEIPHYLAHELTHVLDQCFNDKATVGSDDDDDYLKNPHEIEGFQTQTKFISETEGDEKAKEYVNDLLDHHDIDTESERGKRKKDLLRLAAKYNIKIAQEVSQSGTVELFFGNESNMNRFGDVIRSPQSTVLKTLNDYYSKTEKPCSFDLKVSANSGKGASWQLNVNPSNIKPAIISALNNEFRKIMNKSMDEQNKIADKAAKLGSGSGTLDVVSLELN